MGNLTMVVGVTIQIHMTIRAEYDKLNRLI